MAVRIVVTAALMVSGPLISGTTVTEVQLPQHDSDGLSMVAEFPTRALDPWSMRTDHGASLALKIIITNGEGERHRVASYRSIVPEITDAAGTRLTFQGGTNRTRAARILDFPWLDAGTSLVIPVAASLKARDGRLEWTDAQGLSGAWVERLDRAAGPYHLRFRYQLAPELTPALAHELHIKYEDLWTKPLTTQQIEVPLDPGS